MIMEQKKKVSAAVIIYDPVTSSILASHATGAKFKFDDGAPATGCWGLLKGEIDPGEDKKEAAIREVFEESGIELNPDEVEYIGYYYYNDYKDLEVFLYIDNKHIDHKSLKCDSYFENPDGEMLPEINAYAWFSWPEDKKFFYYGQQKVIEKAIKKVNSLYIDKLARESEVPLEHLNLSKDQKTEILGEQLHS